MIYSNMGIIRETFGIHRGYTRAILGLYWDSGKENENYYNRLCRDYRVGNIEVILGSWKIKWKLHGMMDPKTRTT